MQGTDSPLPLSRQTTKPKFVYTCTAFNNDINNVSREQFLSRCLGEKKTRKPGNAGHEVNFDMI